MGTEIVKHHFVLVHGAWHGAWCWVKLVPELEKAGHRVTTLDLLGAGDNKEVAAEDITSPEEYDGPLVKIFESFPDDEKVILVGHSLGGTSIARMSEKYPNKISAAVYLSGLMPLADSTLYLEIWDDLKVLRENVGLDGENGVPPKTVRLTPAVVKGFYYKKCSEEEYALALERAGTLAVVCLMPPTYLTEQNFGRVPRVSIIPREDLAIPPSAQRRMAKFHHPTETFEVDGDHSLFFSNVPSVLKILNDTAAKYDHRP